MNENPIIVVDHLSKRFVQNEQRVSLRHEAVSVFKHWLGSSQVESAPEQFWALRDVTFSVCPGEMVGIVGRNGAGKSTLLRILAGISNATQGTVDVQGRFATLIALGAGFSPERSGLENVYLNAAIQGVSPRTLRPIIDDIIEFAELRDFIDMPVKRYSTGMTARLGFSVALHILPEIIFLDEILAVGDPAFQDKCLVRIADLKNQNRTVLFVSHSMAHIRRLCTRCIWLHHGKVIMDNSMPIVLDTFEEAMKSPEVNQYLLEQGLVG